MTTPGSQGEAAGITVRPAGPAAIGDLIRLHGEIYCEQLGWNAGFIWYVVDALAEFGRDRDPAKDIVLVAEHAPAAPTGALHAPDAAARTLGIIAYKTRSDVEGQLRFLVVRPEARGQKLGARLVDAVIDHARQLGHREIMLETASNLDAARHLYRSRGFAPIAASPSPDLPAGVLQEVWVLDLGGDDG